ncbi:MAG: cation-translocating P-type ATPase [Anaerolineae bacterium]|nr:cation-translocating P-type ATPase [Anaerolineae bacterium]
MTDWYRMDVETIYSRLETGSQGLPLPLIRHRLEEFGPNELIERGLKNPWTIVWEQLTAVLVVILIVAAVISAFLGDYKDAVAIMAIVVINVIIGFSQEYRAEKAMAALKKLTVPTVKVRRDGQVREISARDLVPGDLVLLEAGNLVPADGRLIECASLRTQESALTGESESVEKQCEMVSGDDLPLSDRRNSVFMGTTVVYGRGLAIVTETGMQTELGHIAEMIQTVEREPTPLQRRLEQVGRGLAIAAIGIVTLVFGLGLLRGEDLKLMLLTAISMAVAAVPEGLPAVVTIALALGAQRMLKRRSLIRKLPAVETLGSITVICSDKTGTLTENRMAVTVMDVAGRTLTMQGILSPQPDLSAHVSQPQQAVALAPAVLIEDPRLHQLDPTLALLLTGAMVCNDAVLKSPQTNTDDPQAIGDPTEIALLIAGTQAGLNKSELDAKLPRVAEVPFTSERKRMTTVHQVALHDAFIDTVVTRERQASHLAFCKGAVNSVLDVSSQVWVDGTIEPLDEDWRKRISNADNYLAGDGIRVLGVAYRILPHETVPTMEANLECEFAFVGLIGMIDPPRGEAKDAVAQCKTAGIRPVMITGDHPLTAEHIARSLGITTDETVLTGPELARIPPEQLPDVVETISVYARVAPEHKLNIVHALQQQGHIVAMTGDGVNDAPALKKADIGVAMGITGTDVSKEAADMVLLDDNFATIVAAVEEGRVIYDNIRKFIEYTMTSNSGEIWVMLLAPFLGMPLPLLPLQILWVNLVTDGVPGLALAVEPAERNTMRRPPHPPDENIFGRGMVWRILWIGGLIGALSLGMGFLTWRVDNPHWQTMVFTTLTLSQMGNALAIRSRRDSLLTIGLFSNKVMLGSVLVSFGLQLAVIYVPFLQSIFKTTALSFADLMISLGVSSIVFFAVEGEKWWRRQATKSYTVV